MISELNKVTRALATDVLSYVMKTNLGVGDLGDVRDSMFEYACQTVALVFVATFVDPFVNTLDPNVHTFVFLSFLVYIVYRVATAKRNRVTSA